MKNLLSIIFLGIFCGQLRAAVGFNKTDSASVLLSDEKNIQYEQLSKAVERYEKLKEKDEWNSLSFTGQTVLKVHDNSPLIKDIKKRLTLLGDFRALTNNEEFTTRMEDGVKRFQLRNGLEATGLIDAAFMKALNVPLDVRIKQLQANMERLLRENSETSGRHIVANIPEFKLRVYEGSREVLNMDIVVGKTSNQTAVFTDLMTQIVFSPYWNVPESIVKNEILPAMKRNPRYLKNNNMEIVDTKNGIPEIRQRPGSQNSLGKVKFLFPNKYNIYFHDTPAKTLFQRKVKTFSHGCIRLSQPFQLAKYLLKDDPQWNDAAIQKAMNSGSERWVTLKEPVPVAISYYTAWVDASGDIHFRDDIYGHDKEIAENN